MRLIYGVVLAATLLVTMACVGGSVGPRPSVKVGTTNFTEQIVLGEIYSQALEANGFAVERRFNLGNREIVGPALDSGQIDLTPEYLSTYLAWVTRNQTLGSPDPRVTHEWLNRELRPRSLQALDYAPAQDTNGFVVTRQTADQFRLRRISDLKEPARTMILGGPPECQQRPFCAQGLRTHYDITFRDFRALDASGPMTVAALERGEIQVGVMFTTDPAISQKGFVLLEDDKRLQLADNVVPVVRQSLVQAGGDGFRNTLNAVSQKLTTEELTELNKSVSIDRRDVKDVAASWLRDKSVVR